METRRVKFITRKTIKYKREYTKKLIETKAKIFMLILLKQFM